MPYVIQITRAAQRQLAALPADAQARVASCIQNLATDPRPPGCKKLAAEVDHWRVRAGDYRIIYRIEDAQLIVEVVRIGHRRDVYKRR